MVIRQIENSQINAAIALMRHSYNLKLLTILKRGFNHFEILLKTKKLLRA